MDTPPPGLIPVLTDAPTLRARVHAKVSEALKNVFPVDLKGRTIEVKDVVVHARDFGPRRQYDALMRGETLEEPIKGTLVLKDADGKVVDEAKNFTLAHVPYFTERHTIIGGGNEYQVANMLRRKSGVYTQRSENGELHTTFNLRRGKNFDVTLDPAKGTFYLTYKTTNVPLYPVLTALGATHDDVVAALGKGVAAANAAAYADRGDKVVAKLYEKLVHPAVQDASASPETKLKAVKDKLAQTELDPDVAHHTLGAPYASVTPAALLAATRKLLHVHEGKDDVDDADSLAFKTFHSVDDYLAENVKLTGRAWRSKLPLLMRGKTALREALKAAPFSGGIRKFVTTSPLTAVPTGINVIELLDHAVKVTALGEGGIPSERAVPYEARMTHPTHYGTLDPIRTPECADKDTEVLTFSGWKKWPDVTKDDRLACLVDGKLAFHHPLRLTADPYKGLLYGVNAGKLQYLMTPNHRVWCAPLDAVYPLTENRQIAWRFSRADEVHGKPRVFDTAHAPYEGDADNAHEYFELPRVRSLPKKGSRNGGGRLNDNVKNTGPIKMTDWASFMGWYLSEGCVLKQRGQPMVTIISQVWSANPEKCEMIEALLRRLPFTWRRNAADRDFAVSGKQLATYVAQFGFCQDKYIPEYFFEASVEARENLLETLLLGDGRLNSVRATGRRYKQQVFCTTSPRLAADVERLALSLGKPVRTRRYADNREERYLDIYEVRLLQDRYRQAMPRKGHYYTESYDGLVYCATVPGGRLFMRRGEGIGHWTGNSGHAGIDLRATIAAHRDDAGNLYTPMADVRNGGKTVFVRAGDFTKHVIAFPHQEIRGKVTAFLNGEVTMVDADKVDYQIPHEAHTYSPATALIPMIHNLQGNRAIMGSKMQTQGLPLLQREAPLVQVKSHIPGMTMEHLFGHMVVPMTPVAGKVEKIDDEYVYVRPTTAKHAAHAHDRIVERTPLTAKTVDEVQALVDELELPKGQYHLPLRKDGKVVGFAQFKGVANREHPVLATVLGPAMTPTGANIEGHLKAAAKDDADLVKIPYQTYFPFPSKTHLHHTLDVKEGDKVDAGQRLGDSNFTRDGVLATGTNLRVAYMAYRGLNSNDGMVISEGCAKKLTSEHMYREVFPLGAGVALSKEKHRVYFGPRYTPAQYAKLDASGVIKKGAKVEPHDLLVVGTAPNVLQGADAILGRISKALTKPVREVVLTWEHGVVGEVVDVVQTDSQVAILIKTHERMGIGDKLASRFGGKGVVAAIIPDHEMPRDEAGTPLDLLITSASIVSRVNPSQILETVAGKVAAKTGKPIVFDNTDPVNSVKWARALLKEHGVKDKEFVHDPLTGRTLKGHDGKGVLVGNQYIFKLFKSTDTNFSGHAVGPYDLNEQPLRVGGEDSAKGFGKMEFDALTAHDARNILQEASTVRGNKNDEFWKALQLGLPAPAPRPSFAYRKFVGMLEGAGVKVDKTGSQVRLLPMTDKDIAARSAGAITSNRTLTAKGLRPEPGGLFDFAKTGGPQGTLFAHIDLHEPVVHPVFEEPVRRLLGLTQREFDEKLKANGGTWFKARLAELDTDKKLGELRARLPKLSGVNLNDAVKQVKYLEALKAAGVRPEHAYVLSKVPVVPPIFRPITPMPNDPSQLMVADANKLYGHLLDTNEVIKKTVLPSDLPVHRAALYNAVGAAFGTHVVENEELKGQAVKGFLATIAGTHSPKSGFFFRKLMYRTQDVSGRGTAAPDGNLAMDEVGIPEEMLWKMFDKLLVARLVRGGYSPLDAREQVTKRTPSARSALLLETKDRPVLVNRAPTLHRFSVVAAYAKPVPGKTIRVSPFLEPGLNLDYDGDEQQGAVIIEVSKCIDNDLASWKPLMQEVTMTARFRECVGIFDGAKFYFVNLADFPHKAGHVDKGHIRFHAVPAGLRVIALDETTGRPRLCDVSSWSFHAQREIEIVTLTSGRQIVSDDDPRAVYGVNAELEYVRARPKDAAGIFVPRVQDVSFEEVVTEIEPPTMLHETARRMVPKIALSREVGRFFGTLVGDGWVCTHEGVPQGVALACLDATAAAVFCRDAAALFIEEPVVGRVSRTGGDFGAHVQSERYKISSKQLGLWVEPLIGKGAKNKHLPPFFLVAPREFRLGMFAGLMDTDGSIATSNGKAKPQTMVNFTSVSLRLCQEVVWLAKSLGFTGTISATKTPQDGPCWQVTFSTPELHKLQSMPCANPEKARRFADFFQGPSPRTDLGGYTRQDPIPTPKPVAERLARLFKNAGSEYVTCRNGVKSGFVSRYFAAKVLSTHPDLRADTSELLQRWIALVDNTAVRWDRVVSYEKTGIVEDGYDLTVPGYETFMNVEGVVLSNTLQVHAPVVPAAVEEAKRMTMPHLLFSDQARNKLLAFPAHEALIGVAAASAAQAKDGPAKVFDTFADAHAAYRKGELHLTDPVEIRAPKHAAETAEEEHPWEIKAPAPTTEEALGWCPPEHVIGPDHE